MPVSKHRKTAHKRSRTPKKATLIPTVHWAKKLHSSRLMHLRNDPDFEAMVKIGRVMNTLSFCVTDMNTYGAKNTATSIRQYMRAAFLLGGYVHQGAQLIRTISRRYKREPAFAKLLEAISGEEFRDTREHARVIRNFVAFHVDEWNETTRATLATLKPGNYRVMCGDDMAYVSYYFEFADTIDSAFLYDKFGEGRTWEETTNYIFNGLMNYAFQLQKGCHEFQQMLWDTKFSEHVY